jgi:hypothetical protein
MTFLAALAAAPLAAQAAPAPARYAVSLNGRVTASYSWAWTQGERDCSRVKMGQERRELIFRSRRPSTIRVGRIRSHADYRLPEIARTDVTGTVGGRSWIQTLRCPGGPVERTEGSCPPLEQTPRLMRLRFRWAGANRIWFRPPTAAGKGIAFCGLARSLPQHGWLNLAIGRVDEQALLSGRARVVARGEYRSQSNVFEERDLVMGETLTVRWTLTFRRLR